MPRPVGGRDYPRNQPEFNEFFPNERACREYLAHIRWPNGFVCPRCGHDEYWLRSDGLYLCCDCRRKTSPDCRHDPRQDPLRPDDLVRRDLACDEPEVRRLRPRPPKRVLGLGSYETAWGWLHKIRRAMVVPGRDKLKGEVEVDETFFGGVKRGGAGGRGAPGKTLVLVAVEKHGGAAGRVRMARIDTASRPVLHGFIQEHVEPGSLIITDGWPHYTGLEKVGYRHESRVISGSGKQAHELLPHVHRVMALAKRWLESTHQGSFRPEHLDYYLDEFTFRFNRRRSKARGMLFYRLLEQAVQTAPQPYETLLSPKARSRRQLAVRRAAYDRKQGIVGDVVTVPRKRAKRPGGRSNRLADPVTRRKPTVKGRRGSS